MEPLQIFQLWTTAIGSVLTTISIVYSVVMWRMEKYRRNKRINRWFEKHATTHDEQRLLLESICKELIRRDRHPEF